MHKNCLPNSLVISRDQIRFDMLKDSDDYFKYEDKVWREYIEQISSAIRNPFVDNIYLDATHLNEKSRNKVLNSLGNLIKNININVIYFDICAAVCCQRNALRSGRAKVPENTIVNMLYRFQTPTFNEKYKYNEKCYEKSFKTVIADTGQWYMMKIHNGYDEKGKPCYLTIIDSLKILPFSVDKIGKASCRERV